jgi:subtilisin-like proprotein convertase family protein
MHGKKVSSKRRLGSVGGFGIDQLEQRAMLSASARTTQSTLQWHGATFTNAVNGSWILTFQNTQSKGVAIQRATEVATALGLPVSAVEATPRGKFARIQTSGRMTEAGVAAARAQFPFLYNIEPETLSAVARTPNDARFGEQWPHSNSGQDIPGSGVGTTGSDIKTPQAWDISTGSRQIVVAVMDTGSDLNHPDLRDNLWRNPGEIPGNNVDDDANGFVDDVYGYDFGGGQNGTGDADPQDPVTQGHGTAVAGVIGATGNNGIGVAGVNWQVSIMTLKIFPDQGLSPGFVQLLAYDYMIMMKERGVNIVVGNGSFGSLQPDTADNFDSAAEIALRDVTSKGMLYVAAAGNETNDNDGAVRGYPASYNVHGLISAAATDNQDRLAGFSNYGHTTVHLGAPGVRTLTLETGGGYQFIDGTSFASPYTAGVVALMASTNRFATPEQLLQGLLGSVDPVPALADKTITGGRLNAFKAVRAVRVDGMFVTNISPGAQVANVDAITVELSKDINPSFFNVNKIRLLRSNGSGNFNTGVDSEVAIDPARVSISGRVLTIGFSTNLPRDTYRLILKNEGFRDDQGRFLNGDAIIGNDEIYDFRVVSFQGALEPNDNTITATPVIFSSAGTASFNDLTLGDGANPAQDVDMFRISVSRPSLITIKVNARSLGVYSGLDAYLRAFDSGGRQIAFNDNYEGLDPTLQFFVPGAGQYYIGVSAFPNTNYLPSSTTPSGKPSGSSGTYNIDFLAQGSSDETIIRNGAGTPIAVPALGDIVSTITVTDGRTITDLSIKLNLTHSFVSDLRITLTGPNNATIVLFNRRGGGGANLVNTVFSDDGVSTIASGTAPFTGTFKPEQELGVFKNISGAGVWTLRVSDQKALDAGTLDSWSITFKTINDVSGPFEVNDTLALATSLDITNAGSRTIDAAIGDGAFGLRDVDLFRFVAGTGTTITASAKVTSGSLATVLRLFDAQGNEVRADRRKGTVTNLINFVVANAGVYYIGVSGGKKSGADSDIGNDAYLVGTAGSGTETDATGDYSLSVSVAGGLSEGPVLLTGNRLSVGVNANGALGLPTGSNPTGIKLDGLDYAFANGALNTFFGASFDGIVVRNAGDLSQSDIPMAINNETDYANRRAVTTGLYRSLGVRRAISFGASSQFIAIDVTLSNRSTVVLNNVAWTEGLQGMQSISSGANTTGVLTNNVRNDSNRLAYSTLGGAQTIAIGAPSSSVNTLATFRAAGTTRDPFQLINSPLDPDSSMADTGASGTLDMAMAFNVGSLAPGGSVSFRYFIFVGNSLNQVTTAFSQLEAGTGTGHLTANPKDSGITPANLPYAIYYPEGYANNRASTFLPIVNSGPESVRVVVIARYEGTASEDVLYDSATDETDGVIKPGQRAGITLTTPDLYAQGDATRVKSQITGRMGVRKDTPYALEIRTSSPIGATMSHYDFGITTGQAAVSQLSTTWTFAEVQKGAGINDFVVYYNPNSVPVKVTFTSYPANGSQGISIDTLIQPFRRGGYAISSIAGIANGRLAVRLDADLPIVAALSHFDSNQHAGYGALGLPSAGSTVGGTGQGQVGLTATNEAVTVFNPGVAASNVTVNFTFANASAYRRTINVQPGQTKQLRVDQLVGFPRGQPYSVSYESTLPVTVSLPSYTTQGASGATLTGAASTQWLFGEGFYPIGSTAVKEFLRVFNPSLQQITIEIALSYNNGTGELFRREIPARSTADFNLFDFITGSAKSQGTVVGVGSFFGTRVTSAVPVVAFMGHYDQFLGGGFGLLGTPLGTVGAPN